MLLNLWAIGRDPNVWGADALEFKPERFMEELGRQDNIIDLEGSNYSNSSNSIEYSSIEE